MKQSELCQPCQKFLADFDRFPGTLSATITSLLADVATDRAWLTDVDDYLTDFSKEPELYITLMGDDSLSPATIRKKIAALRKTAAELMATHPESPKDYEGMEELDEEMKVFDGLCELFDQYDIASHDMDYIHGFLTASAVGPVEVKRQTMLTEIRRMDESEPVALTADQLSAATPHLSLCYKKLNETLLEGMFCPIVFEDEAGKEDILPWVKGFYAAIEPALSHWKNGGVEAVKLIYPICHHAGVHEKSGLFVDLPADFEKNHDYLMRPDTMTLATLAEGLFAIFHAEDAPERVLAGSSEPLEPAAVPMVRSEPKVGRNDPCGCGSGKKFKKCCGQ